MICLFFVVVQELFKPQEMYSSSSTKQIFEKLAHSSIMRLNKSSMDKLYDLMSMGFKRQILMAPSPQHYLVITLNHLETLKCLVDDPSVHELIQVAIDKTVLTYAALSNGQFLDLKHSLMRYLQDKKIKVSLFLQQSLQNPDGMLVLSQTGRLPVGTDLPGRIRYFENGAIVSTSSFDTPFAGECQTTSESIDLTCKLGLNVYSNPNSSGGAKPSGPMCMDSLLLAQRILSGAAPPSFSATDDDSAGPSSRAGPKSPGGPRSVSSPSGAVSQSAAKAELSMLADLLGMDRPGGSAKGGAAGGELRGFKINLFPDYGFDSKGGDEKAGGSDYTIINFDIDATADAKTMARYMEDLDLKDDYPAAAKGGDDDDDDLLALMDSAK